MPTHQGNTQTDIVIGSSGDSITLDGNFEFTATYPGSLTFLYKNHAPGADNENSSYMFKLLDAVGATIATFSAKYKSDPVTGSATNVTSTRTNTFSPSPTGSATSFPGSPATYASREWEISSTQGGSTFAGFKSTWELGSTVAAGNSVSQSVVSQSNSLLEVALTYLDSSSSTILSITAKCYASATATTGVTLGTPSITDDIQP